MTALDHHSQRALKPADLGSSGDFAPLLAFVEAHRGEFNLGVDQVVMVAQLLAQMPSTGDLSLEDLKHALAPVICSSPEEQQRFHDLYDARFLQHDPQSKKQLDAEPDAVTSDRALADIDVRKRRWLWACGAGIALLLVVAVQCLIPPQTVPDEPVVLSPQTSSAAWEAPALDSTQQPPQQEQSTAPPKVRHPSPRARIVPVQSSEVREQPQIAHRTELLVRLTMVGLFALFIAWLCRRLWLNQETSKWRLYLTRASQHDQDEAEEVAVGVEQGWLLDAELPRIAARLREPRGGELPVLDSHATAHASAAAADELVEVYKAASGPEYICLVDRECSADFQALIIQDWLEQLMALQVRIVPYDFVGEVPNLIAAEPDALDSILHRVAAQGSRGNVLIFSDGEHFIDGLTGNPRPWVADIADAYLVTPVPSGQWGPREVALSDAGIRVVPASTEGLMAIQQGDEARVLPTKAHHDPKRLPRSLVERKLHWLAPHEPTAAELSALLKSLHEYLGEDGLTWLAATGLYPELHLELAIAIAEEQLLAPSASSLFTPQRELLVALARLPWLRTAYMPDWLRRQLMARLTTVQRKRVQQTVQALLMSGGPNEIFLRIGARSPAVSKAVFRNWIRSKLQSTPKSDPIHDQVFLDWIDDGFSLRAPKRIIHALRSRVRRAEASTGRHQAVLLALFAGLTLCTLTAVTSFGREAVISILQVISPWPTEPTLREPDLERHSPSLASAAFGADPSELLFTYVSETGTRQERIELPAKTGRAQTLSTTPAEASIHGPNCTLEIDQQGDLYALQGKRRTALATPTPAGPILAAACARRADLVAWASTDGKVRIYSPDKAIQEISAAVPADVVALALSDDGERIAVSDGSQTTSWSTHGDSSRASYQVDGKVSALSFYSSTALLAGTRQGTTHLIHLADHSHLATIEGHVAAVTSIAVPTVAGMFVTGSADGTARVYWETVPDSSIWHSIVLQGHTNPITLIDTQVAEPNQVRIATLSADEVRVWSPFSPATRILSAQPQPAGTVTSTTERPEETNPAEPSPAEPSPAEPTPAEPTPAEPPEVPTAEEPSPAKPPPAATPPQATPVSPNTGPSRPSRMPTAPSNATIRRKLLKLSPRVRRCLNSRVLSPYKSAEVEFTIAGDTGRVFYAEVKNNITGTAAQCVIKTVKSLRFNKFQEPSITVTYEFK